MGPPIQFRFIAENYTIQIVCYLPHAKKQLELNEIDLISIDLRRKRAVLHVTFIYYFDAMKLHVFLSTNKKIAQINVYLWLVHVPKNETFLLINET